MEFRKTLAFALLYGFASAAMAITIPLYLAHLGYDLASMGFILGIATLISGLMGIALAAMSDHVGRKYLISFYSLSHAAGCGIMGFIPSPFAFIAGRSISGLAGNNLWNMVLARVSDLSESRNRAAMVGTYVAAFAFSYSASHFIAGTIIEAFGFPAIFLSVVAASLFMAGAALIFANIGKKKHRFHLSLNILKSREGKLNMLVSFLTGFTHISGAFVIYIFFAERYGFGPAQVGFFIAALYMLWAVFSQFFGPHVDRNGMRNSMMLGALVNGSAWLAAAYFQDLIPFLILMAIDNISWPLYGLSASKISTVLPEDENRGRDLSIFGFSSLMGYMAAAFLGGILASMSYGYVFIARAAAVILSASIVFFIMRPKG